MPFGTRRRVRASYQFAPDPIVPVRVNELKKIEEISKQHLENTSQREEPRPSAKAPVLLGEFSAPPKLSQLQDKLLKRLENGDFDLTEAEMKIVGDIQQGVNKAPTVSKKLNPQHKELQKKTTAVKKDIKESDDKIEKLTKKGLRQQVETQIRLKEKQLMKLRELLKKCPTCS